MSLLQILTILFFIVTVVLFLKSKKIGRGFIPYGLLTFVFVVLYGYFPSVGVNVLGIYTFIFFSLFILLCGLTVGIIGKLCFKSDKYLNILSVVTSFLVILILAKGSTIISYMYIPVVLFKWENIIKINKEAVKC